MIVRIQNAKGGYVKDKAQRVVKKKHGGLKFMNREEGWVGYLRLVTPLISFIVMFLIMTIKADISRLENNIREIDQKVFKHMTNDEIHSPRSVMLPRAEFLIYNDNSVRWMQSINNEMIEIKNYILSGEIKMNKRGFIK